MQSFQRKTQKSRLESIAIGSPAVEEGKVKYYVFYLAHLDQGDTEKISVQNKKRPESLKALKKVLI